MRIGEEVQPPRSLSDNPQSHASCDEVDEIGNDLARGMQLEDYGRLDVEAEEDCATRHQDNPREGCKNCVYDNDMLDALLWSEIEPRAIGSEA